MKTIKLGKGADALQIVVLTGMDEATTVQAVKFYFELKTGGSKTREQWYNVGTVNTAAKEAVNGNTKLYGEWRDKHFPNIGSAFMSCAMKVSIHKEAIEAWALKVAPAINNPMVLLREYQKSNSIKLNIDGSSEKVVKEVKAAKKADELEATTTTNTLTEVFSRFETAIKDLVATDRNNWPKDYNVKFVELSRVFGKWNQMESNFVKSIEPDTISQFVSEKRKKELEQELKNDIKKAEAA